MVFGLKKMTLISRETFGLTDAYGLPIPLWLMKGGRFPSASSAASYLRIICHSLYYYQCHLCYSATQSLTTSIDRQSSKGVGQRAKQLASHSARQPDNQIFTVSHPDNFSFSKSEPRSTELLFGTSVIKSDHMNS